MSINSRRMIYNSKQIFGLTSNALCCNSTGIGDQWFQWFGYLFRGLDLHRLVTSDKSSITFTLNRCSIFVPQASSFSCKPPPVPSSHQDNFELSKLTFFQALFVKQHEAQYALPIQFQSPWPNRGVMRLKLEVLFIFR